MTENQRRRLFTRVSSDDVFDHVLLEKSLFKDYLAIGRESVPETPVFSSSERKSIGQEERVCEKESKCKTLQYLEHKKQNKNLPTIIEPSFNNYSRSKTDSESRTWSQFKVEPPSYWVGCIYRFVPGTSRIELTVQQTGVLPERIFRYRYSKLTASVALIGRRSKTVTLVHSREDRSFRSHQVHLTAKDKQSVRETGMRVRLYHHTKLFVKTRIVEWHIDLALCNTEAKTEWRRYKDNHVL